MSGTVDTKTVEMRFDNKNFESNVKQSMSTLDKLKKSLKLDGASKGLEEVERKSKKLDFKDLNRSMDDVGKKFSALETIATGAFLRIGMKAADAGARIVKSLTVDQIASGWNKYAEETSGVQTIMSNLREEASRFTTEASKMEFVEQQLEKLMWFSDETSYNFTDMTGNIGKFIANGQKLEDSVIAMQGIATWAAKSGQNAQTASRAMYNISQAMGVGAMTGIDWKSIEIANMATAEFKELAIAVGESQGKLKEGQVTIDNFRESLQKKWFDKEAMMEVFKIYGGVTEKIREYAIANDISSTEAIRHIKENKQLADELGIEIDSVGFKAFMAAQEAKTFGEVISATADATSTKWSKFFKNIFGNYLEAKKLWTDLSEDLWNIFAAPLDNLNDVMAMWKRGYKEGPLDWVDKAFAAGKLDKLSGELNYITKEAAEAAVATDSATYSIETLADGSQVLLKKVEDAAGGYIRYSKKIYDADKNLTSGRDLLIKGFKNLLNTFLLDWEDKEGKHLSILGSIKEAFMEVFFPDFTGENGKKNIAERLFELTKKFKDFTENLKSLGDKLKNIFKGVFTVFKIIGKFIKSIIAPFKKLFGDIFGNASNGLLEFGDSVSTWIQKFDQFLDENKVFDTISNGISNGIDKIRKGFDWLSKTLTGLSLSDLFNKIKNNITAFFKDFDFKGRFDKIGKFFSSIVNEIRQVETDKIPDKLTPLQNFWIGLKNIFSAVKKLFSLLSVPFKKIGEFINNFFSGIAASLSNKKTEKAVSRFQPIWEGIKNVFKGIGNFFEKIGPTLQKIGSWLGEKLGEFGDSISEFAKNHSIKEIIEFILKGGFLASLTDFFFSISGVFNGTKGIFKSIKKDLDALRGVFKAYQREINASTLVEVALAIGILAGSLWALAQIPPERMEGAGKALAIIATAVAGFSLLKDALKVLTNLSTKTSKGATQKVTEGIFSNIKSILTGVVNSSIFANDATAKFVKICLGILLAALAIKAVVNAMLKVADVFERLAQVPPSVIENGGKVIGQVLLAFGAFALLAGTTNKASSALFAALAAYVLVGAIKKLVNLLAELGSDSEKMKNVRAAVDEFKDVFVAIKEVISFVVKIGLAIAVAQLLVTAFASLGRTDSFGVAQVLKQFGKNFTRIATSLFIMTAAFAIMASIVKSMSPEVFKKVQTFFIVMVSIIGGILALTTGLASFGKKSNIKLGATAEIIKQFGKTFTRIAASLLIVAAAFALFSILPFDKTSAVTIGLIFAGFLVIVGAISVWATELSKQARAANNLKAISALALTLAASLLIITAAFALFANIQFDKTKVGTIAAIFGGFLVIVGAIGVLATALTKDASAWKSIAAVAGLFVAVAGSLLLVALAFQMFAAIKFDNTDFNTIFNALGGFVIIVGVIGVLAGALITESFSWIGIITVAGLFVAVAGSLILIATAINMMADSIKTEGAVSKVVQIIAAVGIVVAVLAGLGIAVGAVEGAIYGVIAMSGMFVAISASLLVIAIAINLMADSLKPGVVSKVVQVLFAIGAVIAALAIIGTIAGLTEVGIVGIAAIAGLIVAIGAACLLAAAGISMIVVALGLFIDSFTDFVKVVSDKGPEFVNNIKEVINTLLDAIIEAGPKIRDAVYVIIYSLADGLFSAVIDVSPKMALAAAAFITSIAYGMISSAGIVAGAAVIVVLSILIAILNSLSLMVEPTVVAVIALIHALAETLRAHGGELLEAAFDLGTAIVDAVMNGLMSIFEKIGEWGEAVWEKIKGLSNGPVTSVGDYEYRINIGADTGESTKQDVQFSAENGIKAADAYKKALAEGLSPDSASSGTENPVMGYLSGLFGGEGTSGVDISGLLGSIGLDTASMTEGFSGILPDFGGLVQGGDFSQVDFTQMLDGMGLNLESVTESFSGILPEDFSSIFESKVTQPISESKDSANAASKEVAASIEEPITSLDSHGWGSDLVSQYASGMLSQKTAVEGASEAIADIISSYLHHSEPEKGPLSNDHTWAPDMIKLWCSGIYNNLHLIEDSSDAMASKIDDGFGAALDYVSSLIDDGMSDELTLRPVIDLSEIQNGIDEMDSMLGNEDYSLRGTARLAASAASDMRSPNTDVSMSSAPQMGGSADTINNTFYITNSDPDAVARKVSKIILQQVNRKQAVWAK